MKILLMALALIAPATGWSPAGAAEPNGAGDIPDTQAFVRYAGPGYSVLVPEGWARSQRGSTITFTSSLNAEVVETGIPRDYTRTVRTRLGAHGALTVRRAVVGGARAVVVRFASQSAPNAVTGKRVELANEAYFFTKNGRRAILVLSAPVGADNADQYKKISESFRWR